MNKIAIVTGGAGGIGQAVAMRLAKDDCTVIILDLNDEAGRRVVGDFGRQGIELSFHRADLTHEAQVQAVFDTIKATYRRIDVLVNVAGGSVYRHPIGGFFA